MIKYFDEKKLIWMLVALISIASLALVSVFSPFVPDYDGLAYFNQAKALREYFFYSTGEGVYRDNPLMGVSGLWLWPVTNGPGVYAAAFLSEILGANYVPIFVNSLGVVVFSLALISRRGAGYATVVLILLCSNLFFFRLFTTLTSEFLVGLWLFLFLLFASDEDRSSSFYVWVLIFIGFALRTINVVFVVAISCALIINLAFVESGWRRIRMYVACVAPPLMVVAALQWQHIQAVANYMLQASYGVSAASWRSLSGVSGRMDVFFKYVEYLILYNRAVVFLFVLAVLWGVFFCGKRRTKIAKSILIAVCAVVPLFFAQSLNVQVVFWVYAAMVFVVAEVGAKFWESVNAIRVRKLIASVACLGLLVGWLSSSAASWKQETRHLGHLSKLTDIKRSVVREFLDAPDVKYFASNYRGVGPLDLYGLNFNEKWSLQDGGVFDIYTKGKSVDAYLDINDKVNLFVVAHQNYFFPHHFGVNDVISETRRAFEMVGPKKGFKRVAEIREQGRVFDLWYRPGMNVFLQFLEYGDYWVASMVPVRIGTSRLCRDNLISGEIEYDLSFPRVAEDSYFSPPFVVMLKNEEGGVVGSAIVNQFGESKVRIKISGVSCGNYFLSIDKHFSTVRDPRPLSAILNRYSSSLYFDNSNFGG